MSKTQLEQLLVLSGIPEKQNGVALPAILLTAGCAGFSGLWSLSPAIPPQGPLVKLSGSFALHTQSATRSPRFPDNLVMGSTGSMPGLRGQRVASTADTGYT